jgi:putative phosphoribosyl transferase
MDLVAHTHEPRPAQIIGIADLALKGEWVMPAQVVGVALLFHGNSADLVGPRAAKVAQVFRAHRLATLQFALPADAANDPTSLCPGSLVAGQNPDLEGMGQRVTQVLDWVAANAVLCGLPLGLFGMAAGAAAVLMAAAKRPSAASALVCSGGRLRMSAPGMARVRAPTLLIVGAEDPVGLSLNRTALRQLKCNKRLEVLPGASDHFDEPEALESVSELSAVWLQNHLAHRCNI